MKNFVGFYKNGTYSVGCTERTVYIYDSSGKELKKFRDFPYAYKAAFKPDSNIIAVKSTEGHIGFYDLDSLSLIKKHTVTRMGAQDEGFVFSADGKNFYNIEKPVKSTATQLGIYETGSFTKTHTLFENEGKMVLDQLETHKETGICYISGFMRSESSGVFDYGFTAIFNEEKKTVEDIRRISSNKDYFYLSAYKSWELYGFTDETFKMLGFRISGWKFLLNGPFSKIRKIKPITIKEVFDKS